MLLKMRWRSDRKVAGGLQKMVLANGANSLGKLHCYPSAGQPRKAEYAPGAAPGAPALELPSGARFPGFSFSPVGLYAPMLPR